MALSISRRVALVAEPSGLAFSSSQGGAASSSASTGRPSSAKQRGGVQVCAGAAHRSSTTATLQLESPSGRVRSPHAPASRNKNFSAKQGQSVRYGPRRKSDSPALIDIEDSGNGSITFRYGPAEELWDFDRLLEFICSGAFKFHNAESFVALVVEVFGLSASKVEQRRLAKLLVPHVGQRTGLVDTETERQVSSILAESASKFLPPTSVGTYRKGGWRPRERFSSPQNEWWKDFDNFIGAGDGSARLNADQLYEKRDREMPSLWSPGKFGFDGVFKPEFSSVLDGSWTGMFLRVSRTAYAPNWFENPENTMIVDSFKVATVKMVPEPDMRVEEDRTSGEDFLRSAGDQRVKFRPSLQDVRAVDSKLDTLRISAGLEPLPAASIQAMVDWERSDGLTATSLPDLEKGNVKVTEKKSATKKQTKNSQRTRGSSNAAKAPKAPKASRKKNGTARVEPRGVYDVFCGLPLSHKASGVATFLEVRRALSGELPHVLNYVAVGLAATGLAAILQVVARMLCVNATFDIAKLYGIIRGASLVCLSAAIEGVRKLALQLPSDGRIGDIKDKSQLLCLQQRLRRLTSTAMTVMVLAVVGYGI